MASGDDQRATDDTTNMSVATLSKAWARAPRVALRIPHLDRRQWRVILVKTAEHPQLAVEDNRACVSARPAHRRDAEPAPARQQPALGGAAAAPLPARDYDGVLGASGLEPLLAKGRRTEEVSDCLLYTSPSPRDLSTSRMPSSA